MFFTSFVATKTYIRRGLRLFLIVKTLPILGIPKKLVAFGAKIRKKSEP